MAAILSGNGGGTVQAYSSEPTADGLSFCRFFGAGAFDHIDPDRYDLIGGAVCLVGVAVIMYAPR